MTEVLCGTSFSKSTVSRLVGSLDADLKAVTWSIASLQDLFDRNPALDARFRSVIGSDLARKLSRMA